MIIQNDKDASDKFENLMSRGINPVITQSSNNIRVGQVLDYSLVSKSMNVQLNTGEIINNLRFPRGATFSIRISDTVVILSPDPKVKNQNFVVGIY